MNQILLQQGYNLSVIQKRMLLKPVKCDKIFRRAENTVVWPPQAIGIEADTTGTVILK
jgi:hypothetical protein